MTKSWVIHISNYITLQQFYIRPEQTKSLPCCNKHSTQHLHSITHQVSRLPSNVPTIHNVKPAFDKPDPASTHHDLDMQPCLVVRPSCHYHPSPWHGHLPCLLQQCLATHHNLQQHTSNHDQLTTCKHAMPHHYHHHHAKQFHNIHSANHHHNITWPLK